MSPVEPAATTSNAKASPPRHVALARVETSRRSYPPVGFGARRRSGIGGSRPRADPDSMYGADTSEDEAPAASTESAGAPKAESPVKLEARPPKRKGKQAASAPYGWSTSGAASTPLLHLKEKRVPRQAPRMLVPRMQTATQANRDRLAREAKRDARERSERPKGEQPASPAVASASRPSPPKGRAPSPGSGSQDSSDAGAASSDPMLVSSGSEEDSCYSPDDE
eukprot:310411-Rhodomonas_salina.1